VFIEFSNIVVHGGGREYVIIFDGDILKPRGVYQTHANVHWFSLVVLEGYVYLAGKLKSADKGVVK
jgi:hypothetical protein